MKILLITSRSDFGGGPRHVDQLIDWLSSNNEIFVAYPKDGDPYGRKWDVDARVKGRFYLPYRRFSFGALCRLKKFISSNHISVVHSHGNGAGVYSRLLKLIGTKAKIVHTFHGVTNNYLCVAKKWANLILGRFLSRYTDFFICVSEGEFKLAQRINFLNSSRSSIVYNGIEEFPKIKERSNVFEVVTLSRFDYQKNMDLAFSVACLLKEQNVVFNWVGNGPDFSRLKTQAEQEGLNVNFVGFSDRPFEYLQSASIYLSTSRFEGLPYALIEAASSGLPIVATNVVGNDEVVENGRNGYLFDRPEQACEAIMALKENAELYKRMSENSKGMFCQMFTIRKMVAQIVEIYEKVV